MTLTGQSLNDFELRLKSLVVVSIIDVFNEINTEEISKARSDVFALYDVVRTAISSPG